MRAAAATAAIDVQKLRGNVSVLMGSGGNIAVLPGPDGNLLVDAGIPGSRARITQALAALSFVQLFRQSTGQSPHQYVLNQRIDRAKRLLKNQTLSMLDIAVLLGFANAGHFSRVFRRITGWTPSDFRAGL
jgi:hypothetical protein